MTICCPSRASQSCRSSCLLMPSSTRTTQRNAHNFGRRLTAWRSCRQAQKDVGPIRFFTTGVCLFAVKFALDRTIAWFAFGRPWSIYNYLIPNESYTLISVPASDRVFYLTMLAVALPFVWIGIAMTSARLRNAGLPPWLVPIFFIPVANLLFFAVLSVILTRAR